MGRESQSGKVCLPAAPSEIHLNAGSRNKADSWVACGDPSAERHVFPHAFLACCEHGAHCSLSGRAMSQSSANPTWPTATPGRPCLRLCSSCAPCPWVMGVDFLTAPHLALKFPSFWAVCGDRLQFDSVPQHGSQPLSCTGGAAAAAERVLASYTCAHTKPLLPTNTCNGKGSALKSEASRWVAFASFRPYKIKAIFSTEEKNPTLCDLVV